MGGRALAQYEVKRLVGDAYEQASTAAISALNQILAEQGCTELARLIPACRDKQDHGDVDVIMPLSLLDKLKLPHVINRLSVLFGIAIKHKTLSDTVNLTAPHPDGGVYQLDLIFIRDEALDFAQSFFSWGDVSTLLMRAARDRKIWIGPNGLTLNVTQEGKGTNKLGRVVLTRNFKEALTFFGLDYACWREGFDSLEDMFAWFVAQESFSPRSYEMAGMPNSLQKDLLKRPGYLAFLDWLEKNPQPRTKFQWKAYLNALPGNLWESFPAAKAEYDAIFSDIARRKALNEKFNGHKVAELTGLQGKDLGLFMQTFKAHHGLEKTNDYEDFISANSEENLLALVRKHKERTAGSFA